MLDLRSIDVVYLSESLKLIGHLKSDVSLLEYGQQIGPILLQIFPDGKEVDDLLDLLAETIDSLLEVSGKGVVLHRGHLHLSLKEVGNVLLQVSENIAACTFIPLRCHLSCVQL